MFVLTEKIPGDRVKVVTDTIMKLQEFVNSTQRLQMDQTEFAYLKTLVLFSPGMSKIGVLTLP